MSARLHPLADDVAHPAPQRRNLPRWKLWSGLLLAPLAFWLQVMASYAVGSELCSAGGWPRPWLLAIILASLLLAGIGTFFAWASWRATRGEVPGDVHATADRGDGRTRFMALFALASSALFLFGVLVQLLVLVYFGPCIDFSTLG